MNKQRKVLITITYNEMGTIIDTKSEEVAQPNLQQTCNKLATDCISRQAAVEKILRNKDAKPLNESDYQDGIRAGLDIAYCEIRDLPSAEPVHGEWILADEQRKEDTDNDNYRYICSECGHSDLHSKSQEVPYCWWCGAKMLTKESPVPLSLKADGEVVSKGDE